MREKIKRVKEENLSNGQIDLVDTPHIAHEIFTIFLGVLSKSHIRFMNNFFSVHASYKAGVCVWFNSLYIYFSFYLLIPNGKISYKMMKRDQSLYFIYNKRI